MALTTSEDSGFGASITFQSGLLAKITSIKAKDLYTRKVIEYIHFALTSGIMTKQASDVSNPGTLDVSVYFESHRIAAYKTAMTAAAETVTLTFPLPLGGTTAGTISGSGFATSFSVAVEAESGMTADITVELTGVLTFTSAT